MSFGTNVTVKAADMTLSPLAFLRLHLSDGNAKDRAGYYWKGVVYRRAADGHSYSLFFHGGSLKKLRMIDMKDGDLIVYYPEVF